ncbi:MAG: hypothetical protein Q9168_007435 [Polycauliona sp. 1 TL-2023]
MHSPHILTILALLNAPLPLLAAAITPSPGPYVVGSASLIIKPAKYFTTKDFSFTVHGSEPGHIDRTCTGSSKYYPPGAPKHAQFALALDCPPGSNVQVLVETGVDPAMVVTVGVVGQELTFMAEIYSGSPNRATGNSHYDFRGRAVGNTRYDDSKLWAQIPASDPEWQRYVLNADWVL